MSAAVLVAGLIATRRHRPRGGDGHAGHTGKGAASDPAAKWLVSDKEKGPGIDGSAAVRADDVAEPVVENERGNEYVTVNV